MVIVLVMTLNCDCKASSYGEALEHNVNPIIPNRFDIVGYTQDFVLVPTSSSFQLHPPSNTCYQRNQSKDMIRLLEAQKNVPLVEGVRAVKFIFFFRQRSKR